MAYARKIGFSQGSQSGGGLLSLIAKVIKLIVFIIFLSPVAGFFAFKHFYPQQIKSASKAMHLCVEGVMKQANQQSNNQLAQFIAAAPDKSQAGMMKYLGLHFNKFIGFFDLSQYKIKPIRFNPVDEGVTINASRSGTEQYVFQQGDKKYVLIDGQFYTHTNSNTYLVNGLQMTYVPGHQVVQLPTEKGLAATQTATAQAATAQATTTAQTAAASPTGGSQTLASQAAAPKVTAPQPAAAQQAAPKPAPIEQLPPKAAPPASATPVLNKYMPQRSALQRARQVKKQYEKSQQQRAASPQAHKLPGDNLPTKPDSSILDQIDNL